MEAASSEAEGQHHAVTFANLATPHTRRGTRTAPFRFVGGGRVGEGAPSQPVVGAPAIPQPRCAWAVGSPTFTPTHLTRGRLSYPDRGLVSAERREADSGLCPQEQERQSRLEEALPLGSQVPQGEANGPEPESGRLSCFLDESRRAIVEAASSEAEGQHQPITFANLATPHTPVEGSGPRFFAFRCG